MTSRDETPRRTFTSKTKPLRPSVRLAKAVCRSVMPATQNSRHLGNGSMRLDISRSSRGRNAVKLRHDTETFIPAHTASFSKAQSYRRSVRRSRNGLGDPRRVQNKGLEDKIHRTEPRTSVMANAMASVGRGVVVRLALWSFSGDVRRVSRVINTTYLPTYLPLLVIMNQKLKSRYHPLGTGFNGGVEKILRIAVVFKGAATDGRNFS
ncbi:hypothetical protein B0H14DRAFT_2593671 [Mycena olivaceomarginata]|nr:hypothetical protein B0H14DRAFT_2593671 [Mycena olivaceomarginata]